MSTDFFHSRGWRYLLGTVETLFGGLGVLLMLRGHLLTANDPTAPRPDSFDHLGVAVVLLFGVVLVVSGVRRILGFESENQ